MAHNVKTIQIPAQQEAFCVVTGPYDSCLRYESSVAPMVPVLLDSPVVLHLCYPTLFSNQVLKIHAEHLGYFLAVQSVPSIGGEFDDALYKGVCSLFSEQTVRCAFAQHFGEQLPEESSPSLFATAIANKEGTKDALALIRGLLEMFDTDALRGEIPYSAEKDPPHVVFMALTQLFVVLLSSAMTEQDLATVVGVASSVFLELNHGHPLCAATILKPMFVPYFEQQRVYAAGKPASARLELKAAYYKLFQGYEMTKEGVDTQASEDIGWTDSSLATCSQGSGLEERATRTLWFAAPQYGDRMSLINERGGCLKLLGGQTDNKAKRIAALLVSDNVLGYVQCAVFGTFRNMLPCHDNSDLTDAVMEQLQRSLAKFASLALRHQSASLWAGVRKLTDTCLHVKGVGFAGQDKGSTLQFGRVYTGPDEKKLTSKCTYGTFTSVTLATTNITLAHEALGLALGRTDNGQSSSPGARGVNIHTIQSTRFKPSPDILGTTSDMTLFTRFNHRLDSGEFTEVSNVKSMNDSRYNSAVHAANLTVDSKYKLTTSHGALPMCVLTTAMSVRQTVIMLTGYMCAELARATYGQKASKNALCKHLTGLILHGKFRGAAEMEKVDTMKARYGELLKLSGPAFSASQRGATNLNSMEWLDQNDMNLPEHIRTSLAMIGDTREAVARIMRDNNKGYNRVVFRNGGNNTPLLMSTMYANRKYMIHAPLLTAVNLALFSNQASSRALCKLSKFGGSYYVVRAFPNRCIDLSYMDKYGDDAFCGGSNAYTVTQAFDKIKEEVSCILPRIDARRMRMLAPELTPEDFTKLAATVREANIEIVGNVEQAVGGSGTDGPIIGGKRARVIYDDEDDEEPPREPSKRSHEDIVGPSSTATLFTTDDDTDHDETLSIFDSDKCDVDF